MDELDKLADLFYKSEGYTIWEYFYRIEHDPDCIYGQPKLSRTSASLLLKIQDLLDSYEK